MGTYYVYLDSSRQWRWRYVAANYKIIAVSSEAYLNKSDCLHAITLVKGSYSAAVVEG